jgi:hypothetical protein
MGTWKRRLGMLLNLYQAGLLHTLRVRRGVILCELCGWLGKGAAKRLEVPL